jgi:hypothetical protein
MNECFCASEAKGERETEMEGTTEITSDKHERFSNFQEALAFPQ